MTGMVTLLERPSTPSVRFTALTQPTMTEGRKDHIDHRRNFKVEVPERDIEVAGQIAAALQHKQERSGHDELQQEFLDGCQTEIALELDLDEIIGKTDQAHSQRARASTYRCV